MNKDIKLVLDNGESLEFDREKLIDFLLSRFSIEKLAEWNNIFNSWDYPQDFPVKRPSVWEDLPRCKMVINGDDSDQRETRYEVIVPYIKAIQKRIGLKECLRYHHINNMKMKNWQFELWWFVGKINSFGLKYIHKNFQISIYNIMKWRVQYGNR